MSVANPEVLRARIQHSISSTPRSALDEMLRQRIPIQFGGISDPFSSMEKTYKATLKILKILNEFDYPTIISTKGTILAEPEYISLLQSGNYFIRMSLTAAPDEVLLKIEGGVDSLDARMHAISQLSSAGLNVGVRLQPIIPGYESIARNLMKRLKINGAVQVSAEYLKWPVESKSHQSAKLGEHLDFNKDMFVSHGAKRIGREYVLPEEFKYKGLLTLKKSAEKLGLVFGFADNEFLHLNEFVSCCNAADIFLRDANFFKSTILSAVKVKIGEYIFFDSILSEWRPRNRLDTYLNSKSRVGTDNDFGSDWLEILRRKWNSKSWRGGPASYFGIEATQDIDLHGNTVYVRSF